MANMKNIIFCTTMILLLMLTPILGGCVGSRSTGELEEHPDAGSVGLESATTIDNQTETDITPEPVEGLEFDPEITVIEFLESLGYDRSYLLITHLELGSGEFIDKWNIIIEDGFGPMLSALIADGAEKPDYVKFVTPTGSNSPALVQPGEDLPERVAGGLALDGEGYIPVQWVANPGRSEYRKYASLGEHDVCTHRVVIFIDPETGGLQSIHFTGIDLSPNQQVEIDMDTAVEAARLNIGAPDLDILHTELIQLIDNINISSEPGIYWEITFENGPVIYINSVDGTVSPVQPGF